MAREIITRVLCDRHLSEKDESVEADTYTLGVGTRPPHEFDLCADCATPVLEVLGMLQEYGRPIGGVVASKTRPKVDPSERAYCPVEGCGKSSVTEQNLRTHAVQIHARTLSQLRGEPTPFPCGVDDCLMEYPDNTSRSQHVRQTHLGLKNRTKKTA